MQGKSGEQRVRAAIGVVVFAGTYILISTTAASNIDTSALFPGTWSSAERHTGSGFLVGAVVQVLLVLVGAYQGYQSGDLGASDLKCRLGSGHEN